MTEQPNTKISSLCDRYGLTAKRAIYDRINGLNIKPIKKGEVSPEQLERLDRLHVFLTENPRAAIADFPKQPFVESAVVSLFERVEVPPEYGTLSEILSKVAEIVLLVQPGRSPLASYRELEEAALNGWVLPTAVVAQLIGVSPNGKVFARGRFVFNRVGKIGRSAGWKVTKRD